MILGEKWAHIQTFCILQKIKQVSDNIKTQNVIQFYSKSGQHNADHTAGHILDMKKIFCLIYNIHRRGDFIFG